MPQQSSAYILFQLFPFILIIFVFYLLVWKPEKVKQQKHKEKIANLQKNDQIITTGGIHGTVVNIKPTTILIRVDDNVKIEIDKDAVAVIKDKKDQTS